MPPSGSSRASASFGVGGTGATRPLFGATSTTETTPSGWPAEQPSPEDPSATIAVPQQRTVGGTLYGAGGYDVINMTMPFTTNPSVENSGSLTGHILAQGWRDEVVDRRRNNVKVAVAMLVVLGLLVTVSLVFLLTAGTAFTDMVSGVFD
ncbi:MAG TPA: hypothetical protein VGB74_13035 [Actinoplanes sp.]|jgi:hypothetical protein